VAVTPAAFTLDGGGRLNPAWFDGQDLDSLLTTWIAAAEPGSDELVTARVYYRAFTLLSDQAMSDPAMQRDRNKTDQWSAEQLNYWQRQAAAYATEVEVLTGVVHGPVFTRWEGKQQ